MWEWAELRISLFFACRWLSRNARHQTENSAQIVGNKANPTFSGLLVKLLRFTVSRPDQRFDMRGWHFNNIKQTSLPHCLLHRSPVFKTRQYTCAKTSCRCLHFSLEDKCFLLASSRHLILLACCSCRFLTVNKSKHVKLYWGWSNRGDNGVWLSAGGLLVSVASVRTDSAGSSHAT